MRDLRFHESIVLALLLSGIGASACETDGADPVTRVDTGGYGVLIKGDTSTSCDWVDLTGSVTASDGFQEGLAAVAVTWRNETTAASGRAFELLDTCYILDQPYDCLYWSARVPLITGENMISVTAADASNHSGRDVVSVTRTDPTLSVSGKVVDQNGIALSGIIMQLGDWPNATYMYTHTDGSYSISCLVAGTYRLMPYSPNYTFSPRQRTVMITDQSVTGQDFTGVP